VCILPSIAGNILEIRTVSTVVHTTLSSRSNVNIVEWLVSMSAVRVFVGSALTNSFGLASRDFTFDMSAF